MLSLHPTLPSSLNIPAIESNYALTGDQAVLSAVDDIIWLKLSFEMFSPGLLCWPVHLARLPVSPTYHNSRGTLSIGATVTVF